MSRKDRKFELNDEEVNYILATLHKRICGVVHEFAVVPMVDKTDLYLEFFHLMAPYEFLMQRVEDANDVDEMIRDGEGF